MKYELIFSSFEKPTQKKEDLSYLFRASSDYGVWSAGKKTVCKSKKKKSARKQLKEFAKEYERYSEEEFE